MIIRLVKFRSALSDSEVLKLYKQRASSLGDKQLFGKGGLTTYEKHSRVLDRLAALLSRG